MRDLLSVIDSFARGGRYHNIDVLVGAARSERDPEEQWNHLRERLWRASGETVPPDDIRIYYDAVNRRCIYHLQRLARATIRMWKLGALGDVGPTLALACVVGPYHRLFDEDLWILHSNR